MIWKRFTVSTGTPSNWNSSWWLKQFLVFKTTCIKNMLHLGLLFYAKKALAFANHVGPCWACFELCYMSQAIRKPEFIVVPAAHGAVAVGICSLRRHLRAVTTWLNWWLDQVNTMTYVVLSAGRGMSQSSLEYWKAMKYWGGCTDTKESGTTDPHSPATRFFVGGLLNVVAVPLSSFCTSVAPWESGALVAVCIVSTN